MVSLRGDEALLAAEGSPDERGEEEHQEPTERLLLRSQPRMLEVARPTVMYSARPPALTRT